MALQTNGGRKAKFITAIGMFYDLDDPNKFIYSVNESLHPDGIFVAQLMTLAPMLHKKDLGNVCHEHLEYYSYKSLVKLYEQNGLEIFKVVENDIQGGSYQIWARKLNEGSIEFEEDIASLETFMYNVERNGLLLRTVLKIHRNLERRIMCMEQVQKVIQCYSYGNLVDYLKVRLKYILIR